MSRTKILKKVKTGAEEGGCFFAIDVNSNQPYDEEIEDALDDFGKQFYFVVPHQVREALLAELPNYKCLGDKFRRANLVKANRWKHFSIEFKTPAQVLAMRDLIRAVPGVYVFFETEYGYQTLENKELASEKPETFRSFVDKIKDFK